MKMSKRKMHKNSLRNLIKGRIGGLSSLITQLIYDENTTKTEKALLYAARCYTIVAYKCYK